MRIQVLPQTLINQIAAGEVIVRMASVVKELVENAIDAGATTIDVSVENDARDVEVRDNGSGMSRDDAELCLQRHATSKIRKVEDLFDLRTRGFRGEAMPSIASVSRMEIHTREAGSLSGCRVVVEGGRIERIEAIGCPVGTRVIVRDLFYNTPARLKFLKSTISEINALMSTITRQALAQPAIGFRVHRDGRPVLDLPAGQNLAERFRSLLGAAVNRDLLALAHEREGVVIGGVLGHPHDARGDRRSQYLFVNSRPFSSKSLVAALEQACRGFVMASRFPIACVLVEMPAGDVDFNVHPTKEEVRFRDERLVAGTVYHAARLALEGSPTLVASAQLTPPDPDDSASIHSASMPTPDAPARSPMIPGFFQSPEQLVRRAFENKQARTALQADWLVQRDQQQRPAPLPLPARKSHLGTGRHADGSLISAGDGEQPDHAFWETGGDAEPLGQVAETYILARCGNDLVVIDQHAAHERLVYLQLRRRERQPDVQSLLVPLTIELETAQSEAMHDLAPMMAQLGFQVEEFGPRTWAIHSLPADLPEFDPVPMIIELLGDLIEARRIDALADLRDRILIRAACHSAIRAGEALSIDKMRELLRQMRAERLSLTCPHGRPTIIRLSKDELDRQFRRIV